MTRTAYVRNGSPLMAALGRRRTFRLSLIVLNNEHFGVLVSIDPSQPAEADRNQEQQKQRCGNGQGHTAAPVKGLGSMTRLCHAKNVASLWNRLKDRLKWNQPASGFLPKRVYKTALERSDLTARFMSNRTAYPQWVESRYYVVGFSIKRS